MTNKFIVALMAGCLAIAATMLFDTTAVGAQHNDAVRDRIVRIGPLREPEGDIGRNEDILIDASHGLQSSNAGRFKNTVAGRRGEDATKYLWTIDSRGVNIALEVTPFPTARNVIVHTNLSPRAYAGGEAWFDGDHVTINAGSGRYGDNSGITQEQWDGAARVWQALGYRVTVIPLGER